jgi:hypothetical protein
MQLALIDIDVSAIQVRSRITEQESVENPIYGEWSGWGQIPPGLDTYYRLAALAAAALIADPVNGGSEDTVTISISVVNDHVAIRQIDYEYRTAS